MTASASTAPPAATTRRLSRPHDGRIVAGVCAGAGRYFDVDPVIFRVTIAVLTVFGGAGLVIYILAWLLLPEDGQPMTRVEHWLTAHGDRRRDLAIVAAVVVLAVLAGNGHLFSHGGGSALAVVVAALLILTVAGRITWHRGVPPAPVPPAPVPPAPFTSADDAAATTAATPAPAPATATATMGTPAPGGPMTTTMTAETLAWVPQAAPRPRSWLGRAVFGATLLTAGGLSLIATSGAAHLEPADVLAACVAVLGTGLVVAAFAGRARATIPLGVLLIALLAAAAALPRNLTWTSGNRTWVPVAAPASAYVLGAGDALLDLRDLPRGTPVTVTSRLGAGRLRVIAPPGRPLVLHSHVSAGRLLLIGREHNGSGVDVTQTLAGSHPGAAAITLDVNVGFGDVEVSRAAA